MCDGERKKEKRIENGKLSNVVSKCGDDGWMDGWNGKWLEISRKCTMTDDDGRRRGWEELMNIL